MYDVLMVPLFKSNFSIGKSILTLDMPTQNPDPSESDSILQIAVDNKLEKIVLVEDTMIGFLQAFKSCKQLNIQLIFGLRLNCCNNISSDILEIEKSQHKIIIFAKNDNGCRLLNKIYSVAFCEHNGYVDSDVLASLWDNSCLNLTIPFYDSYIFKNSFSFNNCIPNFNFTNSNFLIERNNLPFDEILIEKIQKIAKPTLAKSIYYKSKKDAFAYQAYRCITNRSFGKEQSLSSPNLNHFGSDEFCWESFIEN